MKEEADQREGQIDECDLGIPVSLSIWKAWVDDSLLEKNDDTYKPNQHHNAVRHNEERCFLNGTIIHYI